MGDVLESGEMAIPANPLIEDTRPEAFTPWQAWIWRGWQHLGQGRQAGGMEGVGSIPWGAVQEWLDREGEVGRWEREQAAEAIYAMDAAYQSGVLSKARAKSG